MSSISCWRKEPHPRPATIVTGYVIDSLSQRGISRMKVELKDQFLFFGSTLLAESTTDQSGFYEINHPTPDGYPGDDLGWTALYVHLNEKGFTQKYEVVTEAQRNKADLTAGKIPSYVKIVFEDQQVDTDSVVVEISQPGKYPFTETIKCYSGNACPDTSFAVLAEHDVKVYIIKFDNGYSYSERRDFYAAKNHTKEIQVSY